jgi:hypothetical protein
MRHASVFPTSSNDNLPALLAGITDEALRDLRDVTLPSRQRGGTGDLFARFRIAILADHEIVHATKRRNLRLHIATIEAARRLAELPSEAGIDVACKALAFRAFSAAARAYAVTTNDPIALIEDADAISDLLAAIAADMMTTVREQLV